MSLFSQVFPVPPIQFTTIEAGALEGLVVLVGAACVHGVVYPVIKSEAETLDAEEPLSVLQARADSLAGRRPSVFRASDSGPAKAMAREGL